MKEFEFKGFTFRVLIRDGDPWFVATDVCHDEALSLKNVSQALSRLADDEKAQVSPTIINSDSRPGFGPQSITVISESGLYRLIARSQKEKGKQFADWVFREVLPTIRKTGGAYIEPESLAASEDPLALAERVLLVAKEERAKREAAEAQVAWGAPRQVGPVAAETRKGGETVWNLRDAIAETLGIDTRQVYQTLRLVGAVEQTADGKYRVKPAWSDLLFNTQHTAGGKTYDSGAPRVYPGRQDDFTRRVRDAYAFRFGLGTTG